MRVEIDERSGCCFGVVRAISEAEKALGEGGTVYSLGDIVHNRVEVQRLEALGLRAVGGQVVILGKRGHAEVVGLTGQVAEPTIVIEGAEDLAQIDFTRPIHFLSQTTQSIALFERLGAEMKRRAADPAQVRLDDTICRQVSGREEHLAQFAARFDAVLFVCGRKSSNGKVLFEVCRRANPRTYNIEEAAEIDPAWLAGAASVGICGATSTPRWLMQRVAEAVGALGRKA